MANSNPPAPDGHEPYPEITAGSAIFGVIMGAIIAAAFTYTAMVIGFSIPGSAIAAILGFTFFRGVLRPFGAGKRSGSILSINMAQTITSGINVPTAGVVFTIPALFLLRAEGKIPDFTPWPFVAAIIAGSVLGVAFIIPLRKQMIDLERLRFPSGYAVAAVLRSPSAGVEKGKLLGWGLGISAVVTILLQAIELGWIPGKWEMFGRWWMFGEVLDMGYALRAAGIPWPTYAPNVWAVSLLSVGAGYLSGRAGFTVLIGGVLANWIITPVVVKLGWVPIENLAALVASGADSAGAQISNIIYKKMNRPVGIGMLIGGAVAGVATTIPQVRAAFASLARSSKTGSGSSAAGDEPEELPMTYLYVAIAAAMVVLGVAGYFSADIGVGGALIVAILGTLWLWLAGIIVSQCAGLTDWSPVSGMALIAVTLMLYLTGKSVFAAVLVGAAVCVAISVAADMMGDMRTGYLVGARPAKQQAWELATTAIGPVISLGVVYLIWETVGFGPDHKVTAPQAQALQAAIEGVLGGDVPMTKYVTGALIGGAVSFAGIAGLGVLIGLSMYLPMIYILPYGVGCTAAVLSDWRLGPRFVEEKGVPFAAGLLVGDPLVQMVFMFFKL